MDGVRYVIFESLKELYALLFPDNWVEESFADDMFLFFHCTRQGLRKRASSL